MASEFSERLSAERLQAALDERPFQFFETVSSTNDVARAWALSGAPHGAVVVAELQTAGRGRFGRAWQAPSGTALLFSAVLRPTTSLPTARYTMAAAVSVRSALLDLLKAEVNVIKLKWPNDVCLHDRKVCGILIEPLWRGALLEAVVVGIGVNVRVPFDDPELAARAINLEPFCPTSVDRALLLADVLKRLEYWSARAEGLALFQAWRAALSTLGQRVQVTDVGTGRLIAVGQALDVDEDGALLVRAEDGRIQPVFAGEVTLQKFKAE